MAPRRRSGGEEGEAARRGRCGGGSASPANSDSARRSLLIGLLASARAESARRARLFLLLALGLAAGCVSRPATTFRQNYQRTETDGTSSSSTSSSSSVLELDLQEKVGPDLEYRLNERLARTEVDLRSAGDSSEQVLFLNQPSLDVMLTLGALSWIQGLELRQDTSTSSLSPDMERQHTELLEKLEWRPLGLPSVTGWVDYRTDDDGLFTDRDDVETVIQVEHERGNLHSLYTLELEDIQDHRSGSERERIEHLLRGSYQDEIVDGKLRGSLSVFGNERRSTSRVPSGGAGALPPGEVFPTGGLAAIDTTPEIALLPSAPALVDGDDATPTGINIGGFASGGETHWNMGVGLPLGSPVNLVHLYTLDEVESFLVNDFSFSVWASDDDNFWNLVSGSASFTYEAAFRRFRIVLPEVAAQYVKVVNTASPAAAQAVLVTELKVFSGTGGAGATKNVLEESTANATGSLTWRPHDTLSLTYDVFVQDSRHTNDGMVTSDEARLDNSLSANWRPTGITDVSLRASNRRVDDPALLDEDYTSLSGLIDVQALETLDVALSYSSSDRRLDSHKDLSSWASQARASAQLLDTLQADLAFELGRLRDFQNQRDIDRAIVTASAVAELTPSVDLTLALRNEDATVTGPGAADLPDPSNESYEAILLYQPSDQLTAQVELEWIESFSHTGLEERYRLDWIPFPQGSLDVQIGLDRRVASATEVATDRYTLLTRWSFNPKAFAGLNYARQVSDDGDSIDSLMLTLEVRL